VYIVAHIFVATTYTIIGLSFLLTTGVLAWEFWNNEWFALATFHSHLFLFFPIFGTAGLVAFYLPSVVFVDMYWRHTRLGRSRFIFGTIIVALLAVGVAQGLIAAPGNWIGKIWSPDRARHQSFIWEIDPSVLDRDQGDPPGCTGLAAHPCKRMPALAALKSLRWVSKQPQLLTRPLRRLARDCSPDTLIEPKSEPARLCLASSAFFIPPPPRDQLVLTQDSSCCEAQRSLLHQIDFLEGERQSLTRRVHEAVLPLKTFFLLVLLVISVLLALRYKSVVRHYSHIILKLEVAVLAGVVATVPFPFMGQAYELASDLLIGPPKGTDYRNAAPYFSAAFGIWALMILLFFYRHRDKQAELLGRMGGGAVVGVVALNYDRIVSVFVRYAGVGADRWSVMAMILVAAGAVVGLLFAMSRLRGSGGQIPSRKRAQEPLALAKEG
jgi:hypothetical protein